MGFDVFPGSKQADAMIPTVSMLDRFRIRGSMKWLLLVLACVSPLLARAGVSLEMLATQRTLVLGDSITYGGKYVADIEAYLRLHFPEASPQWLNLGLPSETVSGLSEPGHAGGAFPRPDLHERLDRTLEAIKPEIVLACYGMNCGIYHPYHETRFEAFRVGMRRLHERVEATGSHIIHVTPPVFDAQPIAARTLPAGLDAYPQAYAGYDEILTLYTGWLVAMRAEGWEVVDLHGPMKAHLENQRMEKPNYLLAGDGVHMNQAAHWMAAQRILQALGAPPATLAWPSSQAMSEARLETPNELIPLIRKRHRLLCDAWLNRIGHLRPGMHKGPEWEEVMNQASSLHQEIQAMVP